MYLDKDTILNSLTKEDVKKIVMKLGSAEPREDNHGNMVFQTICHNTPSVNNSYKLYYYHEPSAEYKGRTFHCYSGCQDSFNIVELVIRANRVNGKTITWYKALRGIGQITGKLSIISNPEKESFQQPISDFEWINRLKAVKKNKKGIPTLSEINEEILEIFYYAPHEEWLNDNISREALSQFEIGYYGLTNQLHRDIALERFILEPGMEFNFAGLYTSEINEAQGLSIDNHNDLSAEFGIGLYAKKTFEFDNQSRLSIRAGGSAYLELLNPHRKLYGRMTGMNGSYKFNKTSASKTRSVLSTGINYRYY